MKEAIANTDQADYWAGAPGRKWIEFQEALDTALSNIADAVLMDAAARPGQQVLDIGCGCGATTLALGHTVGPEGAVVGLDISEPLLARAEERRAAAGLTNVSFLNADGQIHEWGEDTGRFDLAASRFGVMFFKDPTAAFANLAKALRPGGRMVFVAWAEVGKNPWFSVPRDAAISRLGAPAPADPHAPGPLAFADLERVTGILEAAGLSDVRGEERGVDVTLPGTARDAASLASNIGPASRISKEKNGTPEDVAAIAEAVAQVFVEYEGAGRVNVPARLNFFSAVKT